MKDIKLLYLLIFSTLLLSTKSLESSEINYIIDATANGTAAVVDLESTEDKYVDFCFDFNYHNWYAPESKDVAFFYMNSDNGVLAEDSVKYSFSEIVWNQINNTDDILDWKDTNIEYTEKNDNETKYYYKIAKTNDEMKTLLFRVFYKKKSGYLMVENIDSLPPESHITDSPEESDQNDQNDKNDQNNSNNSKAEKVFISKLMCLFLLLLNIW